MILPTTGPKGLGGAGSLPITQTDFPAGGHHSSNVTYIGGHTEQKGPSLAKGLIQLTGSCVTLSKTLYLLNITLLFVKQKHCLLLVEEDRPELVLQSRPRHRAGLPASTFLLPPSTFHSQDTCAAHASLGSDCHHMSGTG